VIAEFIEPGLKAPGLWYVWGIPLQAGEFTGKQRKVA
jgi:hypothetical protein